MLVRDVKETGWYWVRFMHSWRMALLTVDCLGKAVEWRVLTAHTPINQETEVVGPLRPPDETEGR